MRRRIAGVTISLMKSLIMSVLVLCGGVAQVHDSGALGASSPGGFQPDTGAAADDDDGLAEQFRRPAIRRPAIRLALGRYSSGCSGHDSSCGHEVRESRLTTSSEKRTWPQRGRSGDRL